jgi:EAL domain-containing protein (putative c-di-GMP-specific phosphodiesterase class I)
VSPGEFIPVAEDSGLIVPIGLWVLQSAARLLARWQQHPQACRWTLSVNVSARQFHEPDFVAAVEQVLAEHGVPASRLCLELTESVFMGDLAVVAHTMQRLRQTGLQFSIDDFGTGYSSLSYLSKLPFDELKIDQSFTRTMLEDAGSRSIALAILGMCRSLALRTLAEGVETVEQRDFLAANDCEAFQGYLLGRPMPLAQFEQTFIPDVAAAAGGNGP